MYIPKQLALIGITVAVLFFQKAQAQVDTLKIMSYNVLNYGDGCQGSNATLSPHLQKIITYTQPDILGLVKVASIKSSINDAYGIAPVGFADSICTQILNPANPAASYNVCPYTNTAYADNISLLFYNKQKLGFISQEVITSYITDFNLYKLYYKDPNLALTNDTTFLFVLLNHTKSGDDATQRNTQINQQIAALKQRFSHLPNLIDMGDFNTRSSMEDGYNLIVNNTDTGFRFKDPPFGIDSTLSYPALWSGTTLTYSSYLTTSTRASTTIPNSCGTGGGGKSWYDHIFLSPWISEGSNFIQYLPDSYKTIGNDGHRLGMSINDSSVYTNTTAPAEIIDALFQFSNKYPITLQLLIHPNTNGSSLTDPDITQPVSIGGPASNYEISVMNPIKDKLVIFCHKSISAKKVLIVINDSMGKEVQKYNRNLNGNTLSMELNIATGHYFISICDLENKAIIYKGAIDKL